MGVIAPVSRVHPLASRRVFYTRVRRAATFALALVAVTLAVGMVGYHVFERMPWLDAFHQAEVLWLDDRKRLDAWQASGLVLQSVDRLFSVRAVKIVPTQYAMCSQSWEIEVEDDGRWFEVLAWGVFTDRIVEHLGGDPARHTAIGIGYGLERLAMLRYGIDDIRKIDVAHVA